MFKVLQFINNSKWEKIELKSSNKLHCRNKTKRQRLLIIRHLRMLAETISPNCNLQTCNQDQSFSRHNDACGKTKIKN